MDPNADNTHTSVRFESLIWTQKTAQTMNKSTPTKGAPPEEKKTMNLKRPGDVQGFVQENSTADRAESRTKPLRQDVATSENDRGKNRR